MPFKTRPEKGPLTRNACKIQADRLSIESRQTGMDVCSLSFSLRFELQEWHDVAAFCHTIAQLH